MYKFSHEPVLEISDSKLLFECRNHARLWLNMFNVDEHSVTIVRAPRKFMDDPVLHCSRVILSMNEQWDGSKWVRPSIR